MFAGSDGGLSIGGILSGGSGDGDNKLEVVTDGDGNRCGIVGELRSGRFKCLALLSGTGNKSKSEKSPSSAKAANISS